MLTSFPPIYAPDAQVLVLGSMPGVRSLAMNEYYGHPRNLFWVFMGEICGADPTQNYQARVKTLQEAGIALWDVLQHCQREGSLDSAIVRESEVANDIPGLLAECSGIRLVAFNGRKAEHAFHKHVRPRLADHPLTYLSLPSTSPANASIPKAVKKQRWMEITAFLAG